MDLPGTQVGGHRTVFCDHVPAVWGVKSASGAFTTNNAICQSCQDPDSQHVDRSWCRYLYGNLRLWLLGACVPSDCKLALRCCRCVARMTISAWPSRSPTCREVHCP